MRRQPMGPAIAGVMLATPILLSQPLGQTGVTRWTQMRSGTPHRDR